MVFIIKHIKLFKNNTQEYIKIGCDKYLRSLFNLRVFTG